MNDLPSRNLMGAAEADLDQIVFNQVPVQLCQRHQGACRCSSSLSRLLELCGIGIQELSTHFPIIYSRSMVLSASAHIRSMVLSGFCAHPFHGALKSFFYFGKVGTLRRR